MSSVMSTNREDPSKRAVLPERGELLTRLEEQHGIRNCEVEALDRSRLMRIVDTFDFLVQHLPSEGAVEAARTILRKDIAAAK